MHCRFSISNDYDLIYNILVAYVLHEHYCVCIILTLHILNCVYTASVNAGFLYLMTMTLYTVYFLHMCYINVTSLKLCLHRLCKCRVSISNDHDPPARYNFSKVSSLLQGGEDS